MKKFKVALLFIAVWFFMASVSAHAQQWAKSYGGIGYDWVRSIQQTSDGGYIMAGMTQSFGAGNYDVWVLKLDASGNVVWQKTYGGADDDRGYSVQQTSDGGYIVAGVTNSFANYAIWVLKLDASGNVVWQKTYGTWSSEWLAIQQTSDGGYIVAGYFGSGGDLWVLKLDTSGNVAWQKTYGGAIDYDYASSIQQTSDGGYIVAGVTNSFGAGNNDLWVLKLDASGNVVWQKTYGGADHEGQSSIQQTTDGGYIVAGYTISFGAGIHDLWVLKLDASGNVVWQKTYGGAGYELWESIQQTADGGYIVVGQTSSFGAGNYDVWVLKLDASGNVVWQKTYGGADYDQAYSGQQTADGGYIVAGYTTSFGAIDAWVLKLDANGEIAGCAPMGTSNASVSDTAVTGSDTFVTGANTSATVSDTSATVANTSVTPQEQCYYAPQYTLTVTKAGTGSGVVTSSPAGIDCGADCSEPYNSGTAVTLTPTPNSGSFFTGWSGDADCSDGQVTADADKTCTATFNIQTFTLSVSVSGSGTVNSSPAGINCPSDCTEDYTAATSVTLTATPVAGWSFSGWGGDCTGTGTCTIMANANVSVTATFTIQSYQFTNFTADVMIKQCHHPEDDKFKVKGGFTLNSGSDGINPLTENVSLQVGTFTTTIPAGSFTQGKKGVFKFKGVINGVNLKMLIRPIGGNSYKYKVSGKNANLTGTVNPVPVALIIGNDNGNTSDMAKIKPCHHKEKDEIDSDDTND